MFRENRLTSRGDRWHHSAVGFKAMPITHLLTERILTRYCLCVNLRSRERFNGLPGRDCMLLVSGYCLGGFSPSSPLAARLNGFDLSAAAFR